MLFIFILQRKTIRHWHRFYRQKRFQEIVQADRISVCDAEDVGSIPTLLTTDSSLNGKACG